MAETVILRPTQDSSVAHSKSSGSTGYSLVNEASSDGDSKYIYQTLSSTSSATQSSTFIFGHSLPSNTRVKSVTMHIVARDNASSVTATVEGTVSIGGTSHNAISATNTGTSYADASGSFSGDYAIGAITATVTTNGHKGNSKDDNGYIRITQIYLEVTCEIPKSPLPDFRVSINSWNFGDTPSTPTVSGNLGSGTVSIAYKLRSAPDSSYTSTVPTEVGEYTVRAIVAETTSYLGATATANFEIIALSELFIQINSVAQKVKKVFQKINGSWVLQSVDDYQSLFTNKNLVWDKMQPPNYLCFTAEEANSTVGMIVRGSPRAINLETSTDGTIWTPFVVGTTTITLPNVGDIVFFRGVNSTINSSSSSYYSFTMTGKIAASGSIMSLLDGVGESKTITANSCYASMFSGCTSLTAAPELSATTLRTNCYASMFRGCTSLTAVPELPATTLSAYCYENMFYGCTKVQTIRVRFTAWEPGTATSNWLGNVASIGTFYCPAALPDTRGNSNIPTGWTKVNL